VTHPIRLLLGLICFWIIGVTATAQATPLAEQVSTARADVDTLSQRLETQRRTARDEQAALRAERAELKRQVRLEQIRRDTLAQLRAERSKEMDVQEGRVSDSIAPIRRAIESAKTYLVETLPFKYQERLRRLTKLESDLAVTHPDPARVLTSLWRFIEEEEAMAGEIGLAHQVVELDGKRILVDVARIGMALMYIKLPNGDVAWAKRHKTQWRFERIEGVEPRLTVTTVFDALETNKILGPKTLLIPGALPTKAASGAE